MTMRLPGWRTRIAIDINCTPSLRKSKTCSWKIKMCSRGRRGRDRMVVGLTTTYAIGAYHHWCCEFKSRYFRGVQHYTFMALVVRRYKTMFSRRSHISRRFVYPKKSYSPNVCLPEEVIFLEGLFTRRRKWLPREIWILRVNKVSYLPSTRAIHCLLYRNYTHSNNDFLTIETRRATTLCVLAEGVAMGARGRGIHAIYFLGARGLGIHEVLSSWHMTFLN
jgi:hypothetical protein